MPVRLCLLQLAVLFQQYHDLLASGIPVQPTKTRRHAVGVQHACVFVDHHGLLQIALQLVGDIEIISVVSWSYFEHTRPEVPFDRATHIDRDLDVGQRDSYFPALQLGVLLVLRVENQTDVAKHRLGARSRHCHVAPLADQLIANMEELAIPIVELGFFIGQRGETSGAPVDHTMPAVHQPVVIQLDEHAAHGQRIVVVKGEPCAGPVARCANGLELIEDLAARLIYVFPHTLNERVAPEILTSFAFRSDGSLNYVLGGDTRVVGTRQPKRLAPPHALEADEHVLQRVIQAVPHVQHVCHVWRRNHDHIRLFVRRPIRRKHAGFHPPVVNRGLDCRRIELRGQCGRHGSISCCTTHRSAMRRVRCGAFAIQGRTNPPY